MVRRNNALIAGTLDMYGGEQRIDNKGIMGIALGMSAPEGFTGGFVTPEEQFIKTIIFLKNASLGNDPHLSFEDANQSLLNRNDVHLFCGRSYLCTTRIDIRKTYQYKKRKKPNQEGPAVMDTANTAATNNVLVNAFLDDAFTRDLKFDLIIFDPPYNAHFDEEYGTHDINHIDEQGKENFLADLVSRCTRVLNNDGIIISKNWRNIHPIHSKFIAGMITLSGGFRRATILEAWQYNPTVNILGFPWEFYERVWETKPVEQVSWSIGKLGKWTKSELFIINQYVDINKTKSGIFITDSKTTTLGNCTNVTVDEFISGKEKHDVIILDDCHAVGGNTPKTTTLKTELVNRKPRDIHKTIKHVVNRAVTSTTRKGLVFTKTYFDPVLNRKDLILLERHVICYNTHDKINLLHAYRKP